MSDEEKTNIGDAFQGRPKRAKNRYVKSGYHNTEAAIRAVLGKARAAYCWPFKYEPRGNWVRPDGTFAEGQGDPRTHVDRVISFDPIGFLIACMDGMALPQASEDGDSIVYKVPGHEARVIAAGYLALFQIDAIKYKKYTIGGHYSDTPYQAAVRRAAEKAEKLDATSEGRDFQEEED